MEEIKTMEGVINEAKTLLGPDTWNKVGSWLESILKSAGPHTGGRILREIEEQIKEKIGIERAEAVAKYLRSDRITGAM